MPMMNERSLAQDLAEVLHELVGAGLLRVDLPGVVPHGASRPADAGLEARCRRFLTVAQDIRPARTAGSPSST